MLVRIPSRLTALALVACITLLALPAIASAAYTVEFVDGELTVANAAGASTLVIGYSDVDDEDLGDDRWTFTFDQAPTVAFSAQGICQLAAMTVECEAFDGSTANVTRLNVFGGPLADEITANFGPTGLPPGARYPTEVGPVDLSYFGEDGDDTVVGSVEAEFINPNEGADEVDAGDGRDVVRNYEDFDVDDLDGGGNTGIGGSAADGVDVLDLSQNLGPYEITVDSTLAVDDADGDTFTGFPGVIGSSADDTITGSSGANYLDGGSGEDDIEGSEGADLLLGGDDDDTLDGGTGTDGLAPGRGVDALVADSSDVLRLDLGDYSDGVVLTVGAASYETEDGDEPLPAAIHEVWGTELDDEITGSSAVDTIRGSGGNDAIDGAGGDDDVFGGDGNDELAGGAGSDELFGNGGNDLLLLRDGVLDETAWCDAGTDEAVIDTGEATDECESVDEPLPPGIINASAQLLTAQPIAIGASAVPLDFLITISAPSTNAATATGLSFPIGVLGHGHTFVSASGGGTCGPVGMLVICNAGDLAAGVTKTIMVRTTVATGHPLPRTITLDSVMMSFGGIDETNNGSTRRFVVNVDLVAASTSGTTCPTGQVGTPPNCTTPEPPKCAATEIGTFPNCIKPQVFTGGAANKVYNGGAAADTFNGGKGNETFNGGGGNDKAKGGKGNDKLNGGQGNDDSDGGEGNDAVKGDAGDDKGKGGTGNDTVDGGAGIDDSRGGAGNDKVSCGAGGKEKAFGDAGNDTLNCKDGKGGDTINGGTGTKDKCIGDKLDVFIGCETIIKPR